MAFTTTMTLAADVDDSAVLAFDQAFLVANGQNQNLDQLATYRKEIGAKSITVPKYTRLTPVSSALDQDDDVASVALADAGITLTPAEYGNVVTRTALASLQTGGTVDLAAARLIGINAGQSRDVIAIAAMDQSSNVVIAGAGTEGAVTGDDIMNKTFMSRMYNKLARSSVPTLADGYYVMVAHDDVIHDIRKSSDAGSFEDVNKYTSSDAVLRFEVGRYCGFRIVRNNFCTVADQTGTGTVDVYNSYFLGFNGLGLAESMPVQTVFSMTDKLQRFLHVGWKGAFAYKIVDTDALWVGRTASSVGTNAA